MGIILTLMEVLEGKYILFPQLCNNIIIVRFLLCLTRDYLENLQ